MYQQALSNIIEKLKTAGLYPLRQQSKLSSQILKERFDKVLPWAMESSKIDFWIVMGKENAEDPVLKTMFTWDMPHARRVSILVFYYDKKTKTVKPMSIGPQSPEMNKFYENVKKSQETDCECLSRLITELNPQKIAIQKSEHFSFCDGLTATLYDQLCDALTEQQRNKLCSAEEVSVRWLQKVTPLEYNAMKVLCEITQDIVKYSFSKEVITPGTTTTTDVEWVMRQMIIDLGLDYWFGPDVDLQRKGSSVSRMSGEVIKAGDLLHCDIGVVGKFIQLHTDMQWVAYVLCPNEQEAPQELLNLVKQCNRFQDIVTESFADQRTGNEVFDLAITKGRQEGLNPMLYTHPLGTFGHGAGPSIGRYDLQGFLKGTGQRPIEQNTCYALELNVHNFIKEWDNQKVFMYLEEGIYFENSVEYLQPRQTKLIVL